MGIVAIIKMLTLITAILVFIELIIVGLFMFYKNQKSEETEDIDKITQIKKPISSKLQAVVGGKFHNVLNMESIYDFMDFDDIKDGMIIRSNGKEFVMVMECNGINFDLRSEEEKFAIEEGFQQFLNAITSPIQLYVQTRGLNYERLIKEYEEKLKEIEEDVEKSDLILEKARRQGNQEVVIKEIRNRQRKQNIYEYAVDSIKSIKKLSNNKNVLHQKTYVVTSYNVSELGTRANDKSKEEIMDMIFNELYIRCRNLASALLSSGVTSNVLNSEELIELLFNAYNRDATEYMSIENYIKSDYDDLYCIAKEVIEKRKDKLKEEISLEAIDLATKSMIKATKKKREELEEIEKNRKKQVRKEATKYVDEYKDVIDEDIYDETLAQINKETK